MRTDNTAGVRRRPSADGVQRVESDRGEEEHEEFFEEEGGEEGEEKHGEFREEVDGKEGEEEHGEFREEDAGKKSGKTGGKRERVMKAVRTKVGCGRGHLVLRGASRRDAIRAWTRYPCLYT